MKQILTVEDFSSKLCYKVFHIDVLNEQWFDKVRNTCVRKINKVLKNINVLDTPTINIKTDEQVVEFLKNNPEFKMDGKGWNPDLLPRIHKTTQFKKENQSGWQYSHVGIWGSHYIGWKNLVDSDYDYALFIEDDVYMDGDFLELATEYINQLPSDWEVFHMYAPQPPARKAVLVGENVSLPYQFWSSACYFLTKEGAKKLLAEIADEDFSVWLPLDWHWFRRQDILTNMYTVRPSSNKGCRLANVPSTYFTQERFFDMTPLVEEAKI